MRPSWVKLHTGIFDDEKIRLIEAMPDADSLIVIWIKLLVQAGKCNSDGHVTVIDSKPITDEMLAVIFNRPVNTIRLALQTFRDFGMIDDTHGLTISNWAKHQNIEGMERVRELARVRKQRQREREKEKTQKLINHVMSRDSHAIDIDLDIDLDNEEKLYAEFEENFWTPYPSRNGKKPGKAETFKLFKKLITPKERPLLYQAVKHYAASGQMPKDPMRFLKCREYKSGYWREWIDQGSIRGPEELTTLEKIQEHRRSMQEAGNGFD